MKPEPSSLPRPSSRERVHLGVRTSVFALQRVYAERLQAAGGPVVACRLALGGPLPPLDALSPAAAEVFLRKNARRRQRL